MLYVASEPLSPAVISLCGDFDIYNADQLVALEAAKCSAHIVLDFASVPYIDAHGIAVLIRMHKARAVLGLPAAHLAALQPHVRRICDVVSLDRVLPIFESVATAVGAFDKRASSN